MTLCIAAVCWVKDDPRIVVSSDWKQESEYASAENQDKLFWVREDWPVLVAGTFTRAVALKDTYRTYFDRNNEKLKSLYRSEFQDVLKVPLIEFKHKLADEFVGSRYGVLYNEILEKGKSWFLDNELVELHTAIRRITLDCQLLFPLFLKEDPFIFRINAESLEYCENFAAIGTGMEIAESILSQRKQDEFRTNFSKTIYNIYEAGRLASVAPPPGVGKEHTICIFYRPKDGKPQGKELTSKAYKLLEEKYQKFGPKPVRSFDLEESFLEECDFGEFD